MTLESNADKAYQHDLPKVSFRIITDDKSLFAPAGVQSEQSRSYGYNDFSDFERPEHYIRYIEPIESELAVQVEYDMDEQDQEWLDTINAERKKEQSGPISYEVFEIIMDKLEKEWFNLSKRIPAPVTHMAVEDSKCSICDDGEGENSNAIVFCDGCNLAVHQDCYGVPYIPEGQWLCRKCTVSPENPVSCVFCPNEGGAFKQTTTGHWAHLLCAIFIPETGLGNAIYMEPVEGVESIPKSRWKLVCSLCRDRTGACIQCDNRNCFSAFHVTCARQLGLLQSMKAHNSDNLLKAYCTKHLPVDAREDEVSETVSNFSDILEPTSTKRHASEALPHKPTGPIVISVTKKSAQAHSKSFRPGPPIVPKIIVNKLLEYVAKVAIRKRQPFVERLCRYWSLKREARRGAPLLKRLHLEPWTASSAARQQTDTEKAQKLKFLQMLRNDLEKVRMLAELVRKREKEKLRQAQVIKDVVDNFIFPHYGKLRLFLEKISAMDRQELFLNPVNRAEVPDYFDVIKEPMCWLYIDEKLEKNEYVNVAEFKRHVYLVLDNAMLYNPKDNPYHRVAARIKKNAQELLDSMDNMTTTSPRSEQDQEEKIDPAGDLEPSMALLHALQHASDDEPNQDLLESIFAFAIEKPKEPTPPPAVKPNKPRKSQSHAERKQLWAEREAAAKERQLTGRTTRAAKAVAKAFADEAGIPASSDAEASGPSRLPSPTLDIDMETDARNRRRSGRNAPVLTATAPTTGIKSSSKGSALTPSKQEATSSLSSSKSSSELGAPKSSRKPASKSQPGVIGIETIAVLTDRERRAREQQLDLFTEQVDPKAQFERFNVGWMLPEGSKRHRAERPSEPPVSNSSRRRSEGRQSQSQNRLSSVVSRASKTPKQEIVPLPSVKERSVGVAEASGSGSDLSSPPPAASPAVLGEGSRTRAAVDTSGQNTPAKGEMEVEGDSITAVIGLESASTSGSTKKRKAAVTHGSTPRAAKRPKTGKGKEKADDEENDGEADQDMTPVPANNDGQGELDLDEVNDDKVTQLTGEEDEGNAYPPDALVWAKFGSFPYFPALVLAPNSDVPSAVSASRASAQVIATQKGKELFLVNFFDKTSTYAWITDDRMDLLGVDEDIDSMYLAGKERGKNKGFKNSSVRKSCRKGYRDAIAAMEESEHEKGEVNEGEVANEA